MADEIYQFKKKNDFRIELGMQHFQESNIKVTGSIRWAVLCSTADSPTFCMAHRSDPNPTYQLKKKKRVAGSEEIRTSLSLLFKKVGK